MSGFVDTLRAGTNQFRRKFSKKNTGAQSVAPLKIDASDDAFFGKMRMEDLETALNQLPDVHAQRPNHSLLASEPFGRESLVTPTTPQGSVDPNANAVTKGHAHPHAHTNVNVNVNVNTMAPGILATSSSASPSGGGAAAYIYPHSTLQRPYVASLQPKAYETHRPIIQFPNALQPKTEDDTHLGGADPDLTLQPMFPDRSVENLHQLNQVLLSTSSPTAGAGATISSNSTGYNDNQHRVHHTASSTTSSTSSELPYENRARMTAAGAVPGSSSSLSSHQHHPAKSSLLASSKNNVRRVSMPPEANGSIAPPNFEEVKFETKLQPRSISESILSFDPTTNAALAMQEDEGLAEEFERANSAPWTYDPNAMEGLDGASYETESQPLYPDLVLNSIHKDPLHGSPGQQFDELLPRPDFRNSNSSLVNAMKKYDDDVPMAFDASFFGSRDVIEEDDAFPSPVRSHASKFASQQSSIHASPHRQAPSSLRTPKSMFGNMTLFSPSNAHLVHYQQQNIAGSAGLNSLGSTPRSSNVSGVSTPSKGNSIPGTPTSAVNKKVKRKPKTYSNKDPSLYCHICARDSRRVPVVVCSNYTIGTCRKVVCKSCFEKFDWDFESASRDGSVWVCSHCLESCPESARCHIYDRINAKRAK